MVVGREMLQHGRGRSGFGIGLFEGVLGAQEEISLLLLSSYELVVTKVSVLSPRATLAGDKHLILDLFHSRVLRPEMGKDQALVGSPPKPSQKTSSQPF